MAEQAEQADEKAQPALRILQRTEFAIRDQYGDVTTADDVSEVPFWPTREGAEALRKRLRLDPKYFQIVTRTITTTTTEWEQA